MSCTETQLSKDESHEHNCDGKHLAPGCHWCTVCRRWWWTRDDTG